VRFGLKVISKSGSPDFTDYDGAAVDGALTMSFLNTISQFGQPPILDPFHVSALSWLNPFSLLDNGSEDRLVLQK